ncbi:hypothetical protein BKA69DRAFT_21604 [Paraphysoderma sedebokerense]|nr:hypothetical protein BKA69DRAFT_21604 [Paraphysoderma sedebokerense]
MDDLSSLPILDDIGSSVELPPQSQPQLRSARRAARKYNLKRKQHQETVSKYVGLPIDETFSSVPTNTICLLNVGSCGITDIPVEVIESIFQGSQGFERVEMRIGRPFSYVIFTNHIQAEQAFNRYDLQPCPKLNDRVLLLEYVDYSNTLRDTINIKVTKNIPDSIGIVPGLSYFDDVLSDEEELSLISYIKSINNWDHVQDRFVKHYGYNYDYTHFTVSSILADRIPTHLTNILFPKFSSLFPNLPLPNQCTVSVYPLGTGIPPHSDIRYPFGPIVWAVSLQSGTMMEFLKRGVKKGTNQNNENDCEGLDVNSVIDKSENEEREEKQRRSDLITQVYLKRKSLLLLQNEARYDWEHSIRARKTDLVDGRVIHRGERISLTFRAVTY